MNAFSQTWQADVLTSPPMIAPARQFVYPMQIAGEEDALARGALNLMVRPANGGNYLLACALGYRDPALPTGVYACPNSDEMCAVAGGYAYLANTLQPERCVLLGMKPVVSIHALPASGLLIFAGFHNLLAWGMKGKEWETARLSWEGLRVTGVVDGRLEGFGWDMRTDREKVFSVDLATGAHTGGAFPSGTSAGASAGTAAPAE